VTSFVSIIDASVPEGDDNHKRGTFADRASATAHIATYIAVVDRNLGETGTYEIVEGTELDAEDEPIVVTLEIENRYANYGDVTTTIANVVIPKPWDKPDTEDYDEWQHEHIIGWTGVGHCDGDSWYDVTVTASSDPEALAVGTTFDWGY
jgi:hypothetical protein